MNVPDGETPPATTMDLESLPNLKTAFPFTLAIDTRTFQAPFSVLQSEAGYKVDALQLHVPLEGGRPVLPDEEEIERGKDLQKNLALSTVIHLEPDPRLGSADEARRADGVRALKGSVERLKPLVPTAYILELVPEDPFSPSPPRSLIPVLGEEGLADWKARLKDSFTQVVESCRVPFPNFCLETSTYPIAEILDLANQNLFSFCLDIGTLFQHQYNITEHIEGMMSRTKVFHLHGVSPSGDPHSSLEDFPFDHTVGFLGTLASAHYVGAVCLEVRFLSGLIRSLEIADRAYRELRGLNG